MHFGKVKHKQCNPDMLSSKNCTGNIIEIAQLEEEGRILVFFCGMGGLDWNSSECPRDITSCESHAKSELEIFPKQWKNNMTPRWRSLACRVP